MNDFQLRASLTDFQWQAINHFFGPMKSFEYTHDDEKKTRSLMTDVHESFYASLLYLYKLHKQEIEGIRLYFSLESEIKQFEIVRNEIEKLSESGLKQVLLKLLPDVKPIGNNGRPKNEDTVIIEACNSFASFIWYYNLIPGKTGKPSKDAVYRFVYDFIKACGHTFRDQNTSAIIKDIQKVVLQEMDKQKIDL